MRTVRLFWFIVSIGVGLAVGLWIAWRLFPFAYQNVSPHHLRADYQTDLVLMTAEIYAGEGNINQAVEQLAFVSDEAPSRILEQAIQDARQMNYDPGDLELLIQLSQALNKASGGAQ